jgi:hypothetical protein
MANTLAYYGTELFTAAKRFVNTGPGFVSKHDFSNVLKVVKSEAK